MNGWWLGSAVLTEKKIIDLETGKIYDDKECVKRDLGISAHKLSQMSRDRRFAVIFMAAEDYEVSYENYIENQRKKD